MNTDEEFELQTKRMDLNTLLELKDSKNQELYSFYKNNFESIKDCINASNPRLAVESLENIGLPKQFDFNFKVQINSAIKRGNINSSNI